jgi:hypothetical protein
MDLSTRSPQAVEGFGKGSRRFVAATLAVVLSSAANAQPEAPEESTINVFEGPVIEERVIPAFPLSAARVGIEGWVEVNYMVDTEGKAYEIMVLDHAGNEAFIEAVQVALERSTFRPARMGDEVVASSDTTIVRFALEGADDYVGRDFAAKYNRFRSALRDGSRTDAGDALSELEKVGLSYNNEYAQLNLARYFYAERYGTTLEQMDHLKRALGENPASPEQRSYLGREATTARRGLVQLQLRNRYFGEALETLELMRLKGDEEGVALFSELSAQLGAVKAGDDPYGVAGQIGDNGYWSITLFKNTFHFDDLMGSVAELKLRCRPGFVFFNFEPETQYEVSAGARECTLQVIGTPGTTFTLVQQ